MDSKTLSPETPHSIAGYWLTANYLSVGQIYLFDNPDLIVACVSGHGEALTVSIS